MGSWGGAPCAEYQRRVGPVGHDQAIPGVDGQGRGANHARPGRGTSGLRRADGEMWRIGAVSERHNDPVSDDETGRTSGRPLYDEEIEQAEAELGSSLPEALRAVYVGGDG